MFVCTVRIPLFRHSTINPLSSLLVAPFPTPSLSVAVVRRLPEAQSFWLILFIMSLHRSVAVFRNDGGRFLGFPVEFCGAEPPEAGVLGLAKGIVEVELNNEIP